MKLSRFHALTLLYFVGVCFASEVIVLNDDNFNTQVSKHAVILVEFYAPWCGHCKALAPKYDEAASILKKNDPPVYLAKIDCTEAGKKTCEKYSVSGYPALKVFRRGEFSSEYNSGREVKAIVNFMKAQVGPSSKELKSLDSVDSFTGKEEVTIIGFFESDSSLKKEAFLKFADQNKENYKFGHTTANDVLKKYGYKEEIVLFRPKKMQNKFEDSQVVFKGDIDSSSLNYFIKENYYGLVGYKTRENFEDFPEDIITAYYKVDYVKNPKGTNYWRNRILKAAQEFKGQIVFAIANKDEFIHELNSYGFDYVTGDKPVVTAKKAGLKYIMQDEFNPESLKQFTKHLLTGDLEPYIKSEPVPKDNDKNPVKIAVAKNFKELVTDSGKDALVEFYAPWCGHCKKLTPIYEELGKELQNEPGINIVKMDATANDAPAGFDVSGFPTIYFVPKGRSPVQYQGGRDLQGFIKYLAKEATDELISYDRDGKKKKTEL